MQVKLLKRKNLHPKKYKAGDIAEIPDGIAQRWIERGIATSPYKVIPVFSKNPKQIKVIKFDRRKHVHIRDLRDGWIMQKFGDQLMRLSDKDILFTIGKDPDPEADINYYINWTNGSPRLYKLPKSKCDIILFTHFEQYWKCYAEEEKIIEWADLYTCMSSHGRQELIDRGANKSRIKVIKGIGTSIDYRRKVRIGWGGKPNFITDRKGSADMVKLAGDVDSEVFKFIFYGRQDELIKLADLMRKQGADVEIIKNDYRHFIDSIDYYLSPSKIEGGPMDMLNAYYAGIPIISRDIGFFCDLKSKDDHCYKDYNDLKKWFKGIERKKKLKFKRIKPYNWDNFVEWHRKYFKKVLCLK